VSYQKSPIPGELGGDALDVDLFPPPVELMVMVLDVVQALMVMLLPGTMFKVSVGEDANIKEELALIVANESEPTPCEENCAIDPLDAL
jgi:hypothetical protein